MRIPLYQIDTFTDTLFNGNPAAVCPLDVWLEDYQLQAIATENNVSETAFFIREKQTFALRWFSPLAEVDLCGHATLAAAYVIFNFLRTDLTTVTFSTKSGQLIVAKEGSLLGMDFPARPGSPCDIPDDLVRGLGITPQEVLKSRDYLVILDSEEQVKTLHPNFNDFMNLDSLGVIVSASGTKSDFVSRFFAPKVGISEDPVTGSSHCTLTPYWAAKLQKKKLHALQLSQRGGELFCEDRGDRVKIAGRAVTYFEGYVTI